MSYELNIHLEKPVANFWNELSPILEVSIDDLVAEVSNKILSSQKALEFLSLQDASYLIVEFGITEVHKWVSDIEQVEATCRQFRLMRKGFNGNLFSDSRRVCKMLEDKPIENHSQMVKAFPKYFSSAVHLKEMVFSFGSAQLYQFLSEIEQVEATCRQFRVMRKGFNGNLLSDAKRVCKMLEDMPIQNL